MSQIKSGYSDILEFANENHSLCYDELAFFIKHIEYFIDRVDVHRVFVQCVIIRKAYRKKLFWHKLFFVVTVPYFAVLRSVNDRTVIDDSHCFNGQDLFSILQSGYGGRRNSFKGRNKP